MELIQNLSLGWQQAVSPTTLLFCFLGVLLGTFVGVLPGIGALAAISLLLPLTYHLDATSAIVMLAGVYYGTQYGGSTASILLNLPGTPQSAVVCLDGYPMAKQGRAGVALFVTAIASFVGAMFGLVLLVFFAPIISKVGLSFGPWEYFSAMLLGLIATSTISSGSALKGLSMIILGMLLGTVGVDVNSGVPRFHFGVLELMDGIGLVALSMGIFGVAEVISSINKVQPLRKHRISFKSMLPTAAEARASVFPMLRGSAIGSLFGALPGVGGAVGTFMAYGVEKRVSKDPSRFGEGAIEGVASPEASNNAAVQTAFVPSLTLGIPGDAVMAIMLGALLIHGIAPGPLLISNEAPLFWGLVVSFVIGNLFLLVLNIPLIGMWVKIIEIPYRALAPTILVFIAIGVFSVSNNVFDIFMVVAAGTLGYLMFVFRFSPAPLILGFVLGPLMEEYLRRALVISRGNLMVFIERPISGTILLACLGLLLWSLFQARPRAVKT